MRAGRVARRADQADLGAGRDSLADADVDSREMGVERADAVADRDRHLVAPSGAGAGEDDAARAGRQNRDAERSGDVDPGMEAVAARAEPVPEQALERPVEPDRRARRRAAQGGTRQRAGDAGRRQSGPALEPQQRSLELGPERTVELPRREAVPGEEILELGDVPAGHSLGERAAAKRGLAPGAEGNPCLEPAAPVAQRPNGRERPRPGEAVDRAAVEMPAAQA